MQSSSVPITELIIRSAYSDKAAVMSYSRRNPYSIREVVNCDKLTKVLSVPSYSYIAPTALGIKVFFIFLERFLHRCLSSCASDSLATYGAIEMCFD